MESLRRSFYEKRICTVIFLRLIHERMNNLKSSENGDELISRQTERFLKMLKTLSDH